MSKTEHRSLYVIWTDDEHRGNAQALNLGVTMLRNEPLRTPLGHIIAGRLDDNHVIGDTDFDTIVRKIRELWGGNRELDGLRCWIADISYPTDPLLGLKLIQTITEEDIDTQIVIVVSQNANAVQMIDSYFRSHDVAGHLRPVLKHVWAFDLTLHNLRDAIVDAVDERLGRSSTS